jgi:hypothetical protein
MGAKSFGDSHHFFRTSHLEVEHGPYGCGQARDVVVLNVSPVLPKVGRDTVGTGAFADERAFDGVGEGGAPRLPKRRDVIDVDVESLAGHVGRISSPLPR